VCFVSIRKVYCRVLYSGGGIGQVNVDSYVGRHRPQLYLYKVHWDVVVLANSIPASIKVVWSKSLVDVGAEHERAGYPTKAEVERRRASTGAAEFLPCGLETMPMSLPFTRNDKANALVSEHLSTPCDMMKKSRCLTLDAVSSALR
jgi:hypothetical protein